ncbi:MAG: Crp/Fnr family transcriptional regulator [Myxococcota bacterium]
MKDALLVVGSGRLRERRGTDDRELTLTYAGPGDLVGEASFLGGTPTLDFVGVESGEGARVLASVVRDVMRSAPDLAIAFAARIERRRQNVEERLHALLTRTVEHRVLSFIAEAAVREGIPTPEGVRLAVRYTHLEIARYVGSTRETVTLVLGELRRKGLVAIQQRWLIVPDVGRLEATLDAGG